MPYIGKSPTPVPLSASDLDDDIISLAKLASGTDGNIITYDTSGNPAAVATGNDGQVLTSAGAGQPCAFEAAGGTTKKRHHFTFATRTVPSNAADTDCWTWTGAFTPDDPVNNDMWISYNFPCWSRGTTKHHQGVTFTNNSTTTVYTYMLMGYMGQADPSSIHASLGQQFNIAAGSIPAGTYTVKFRNGTPSSNAADYFFPNASDHADFGGQTQGEFMITEWKN